MSIEYLVPYMLNRMYDILIDITMFRGSLLFGIIGIVTNFKPNFNVILHNQPDFDACICIHFPHSNIEKY